MRFKTKCKDQEKRKRGIYSGIAWSPRTGSKTIRPKAVNSVSMTLHCCDEDIIAGSVGGFSAMIIYLSEPLEE